MDDKNKKLRQSVWRLLHLTAGPYFRRRFNYSCEPVEIEPPFLLISNHVTNSDPFFVGLSYKRAPLSFVASEHIFRKGFVSGVLKKLLAPIPRSKAASGAVNFSDISLIYLYLMGEGSLSPQGIINSDFNCDGSVTFADVSEIYLFIIGE